MNSDLLPFKKRLFCILLLKALLALFIIEYSPIHLGPDEAQYWTWSQALDFGYYSKPPGIAWQIWLSTALLGQTELGIRSSAVLISFLLSLAIFHLARQANLKRRQALFAAVVFALTPLGIFSSLFATTDGASILFQTLAWAAFIREKEKKSLWQTACFILLGALFKWTTYLLWLFFIPYYCQSRLKLKSETTCLRLACLKPLVIALLISFLGLLPSLYWNLAHDFVTFRHVFYGVVGQRQLAPVPAASSAAGNPLEFLGAQLALISPLIFGLYLLCVSYLLSAKARAKLSAPIPPPVLQLGQFSALSLLTLFLGSFFAKMQGNWCAYAYPAAMVYLASFLSEENALGKWLKGGIALSLSLFLFILAVPTYQQLPISHSFPFPYQKSPFKHLLGWEALAPALTAAGYEPKKDYLFADSYQMTSLLSFYGPEQKRAYFINLRGTRQNQFSYWPSLKQEADKVGYFVYSENNPHYSQTKEEKIAFYRESLQKYFGHVEYLSSPTLFVANGEEAKGALLFRCQNWKQVLPKDPSLY